MVVVFTISTGGRRHCDEHECALHNKDSCYELFQVVVMLKYETGYHR